MERSLKICPVCKTIYSSAYTVCRECGLGSGRSAPYLVYLEGKRLKKMLK